LTLNDEGVIRRPLSTPGTWAVVGCSPDPARDSHRIAASGSEPRAARYAVGSSSTFIQPGRRWSKAS